MTALAEKIVEEFRDLSLDERVLVTDQILTLLHQPSHSETWDVEIARRCEEIDNGTAELFDGHVVLAELRAKYQ